MIKQRGGPQKNFFKFLDGVSTTISSIAPAFRVLYWRRQQCNQISDGCFEIFKKIITLITLISTLPTVTVLFLFAFFNLILELEWPPYMQHSTSFSFEKVFTIWSEFWKKAAENTTGCWLPPLPSFSKHREGRYKIFQQVKYPPPPHWDRRAI